jgi:hypothetical protein
MKLACPKCEEPCGLFQNACPRCGFALTLGSVLAHYRDQFKARAAFQCPQCREPVPVTARTCAKCGAPITVRAAIDTTLAPPKRRWREFRRQAGPGTKRSIQWGYLLFSFLLLGGLLTYIAGQPGAVWLPTAALSVVYLAVFGLLALLLVPRRVFRAVYWGASAVMKLSLVCNFLSVMILLQFLIGAWWGQAVVLAILFGVVWLAAYIFHIYVLPMAAATEQVFIRPGERDFDSKGPQGRDARWD